jgi:hypothetical protein
MGDGYVGDARIETVVCCHTFAKHSQAALGHLCFFLSFFRMAPNGGGKERNKLPISPTYLVLCVLFLFSGMSVYGPTAPKHISLVIKHLLLENHKTTISPSSFQALSHFCFF